MTGTTRHVDRGASLILVISLVAILAIVSAALIKYAGDDRINSARRAQQARGLSCADAGIELARRIVGCAYKTSNNWNDYLVKNDEFDPPANKTLLTGNIDGTFPGGDFEVTVEDDRDEEPEGLKDDPARDNNLTVILRSQCVNPQLAVEMGEQRWGAAVEVRLVYIPGLSDHGAAPSGSNAMESAVGGSWVRTNASDCPDVAAPPAL